MPTDTTVKVFHNLQAGAPVQTGLPGALLSILSSCLVDGFGPQTVDSIVVAGGIATVTRAAGLTFAKNEVPLISGATPAGLNGEKKVLTATGTQYTFDATGISDQTATGTIQHQYASLGWAKPHSGTNIAHFRAASGTRMYLRVDDSASSRSARGHGMEWANSITDFGALFPNSNQQAGGHHYARSNTIDSTARPWILIGDHRAFYLMTGYSEAASTLTSAPMSFSMAFGDLISDRTGGDAYGCFSHGFTATLGGGATSGTTPEDFDMVNADGTSICAWIARPYHHGPSPAPCFKASPRLIALPAVQRSGGGSQQYPNGSNGAAVVAPAYLVELGPNCVRGSCPGLYFSPQGVGKTGKNLDRLLTLTGTELTGKDLMRVNSNSGFYAFDVAGPWR